MKDSDTLSSGQQRTVEALILTHASVSGIECKEYRVISISSTVFVYIKTYNQYYKYKISIDGAILEMRTSFTGERYLKQTH